MGQVATWAITVFPERSLLTLVAFVLAIAISEGNSTAFSSLWVLLSGVAFVLACFYVMRPIMWWLICRIPKGETIGDVHVTLILTGVMIVDVCTDTIGIHSVFGAFVYGLVIPNGPLDIVLIEKLEDFVTGPLLPLFFAISGLHTNITKVRNPITMGKPLSPGCKPEYTRLSTMLELLKLKASNGWFDKSFTALLGLLADILPGENVLPSTTY